MWGAIEADDPAREAMRRRVLAFLDEYCRDLTLHEAGEWYEESLGGEPRAS